MQALLRARMPERAVTADVATPDKLRRYGSRNAPGASIQTIGDIARHAWSYTSPARAALRPPARSGDEGLRNRAIAPPRLRCRRCSTSGVPKIRPHDVLQVGGSVTLAFLWCSRCIWEIDQAQLDRLPWSGSRQCYRCPGCRHRVEWHIYGPAWRPGG
jgi:hypothetical protein